MAEGVEFAEEWYVTDLVITEDGSKVEGVVAFDTHKGQTHAIHPRNVLLATGGAGKRDCSLKTANSCNSTRLVWRIPAFCCLKRHERKAACFAMPMARHSWKSMLPAMPIWLHEMW